MQLLPLLPYRGQPKCKVLRNPTDLYSIKFEGKSGDALLWGKSIYPLQEEQLKLNILFPSLWQEEVCAGDQEGVYDPNKKAELMINKNLAERMKKKEKTRGNKREEAKYFKEKIQLTLH